jgi:hypothetical protein
VTRARGANVASAGASQALGYDVKELGRDQGKLTARLEASRD